MRNQPEERPHPDTGRSLIPCPSLAAFNRHKRKRRQGIYDHCDDPDGCRAAYNQYMTQYRESRRLKKPEGPTPCPSYAAWQRHKEHAKAGKPYHCKDPEACRDAYNQYGRERYQLFDAKPRKPAECPSAAAYQRHKKLERRGETDHCTDPEGCRAANKERLAKYRANNPQKPATPLTPCPSAAAQARHLRHRRQGKEVVCTDPEGCRDAYNQMQRDRIAERKQRKQKPEVELAPCPSAAAQNRHYRQIRNGEPSDCTDPEGCREAANQLQREIYAERKRWRT